MKGKFVSGILLALLILNMLTFAFNGQPAKAASTLTVIGPWFGSELDKFLPVLEAFEAMTPDINVEYNPMLSYELVEILPEMFATETTPGDIIYVWPWFIREMGPQGHAVNVTHLINETDFRPGALDEVKVDDTLYGGAYTGKAKPGFWYRKSFFEANLLTEPTTWEEFLALLETISGMSSITNPIVSGDGVGWPLSDVTEHFLITFGNPQLQRDLISGEAKWIRPPVRTIFEERLVPLLDAGYFSGPIEWTSALESWWAGDYGLYFMGSWITGMVPDPNDLGVFSLPGGEGVVFAPDYFFIPEYTEYPDEAVQLFQFLANAEAQEIQVEQGGHIATNIHVPLEAYPSVDRMVAELMEGMEVLPDLDDAIDGEFQTTFWDKLKLLWIDPGQLDAVLEAIQAVAPAKTWTVDDDGPADFATIQEAINAATDRDTIFVHRGIYYENVIVNKSVSLIAEATTSTIVDGIERGHVFNITRDNAKITGFTIRNSGNPSAGIYLGNVNYSEIIENQITNDAHGIWLLNSSHNRISGNNIRNNDHGIYLEISSNHNRIYGNHLTSNYNGSIALYASVNNRISWNHMTNSSTCVMLNSSSDNILSGNHLADNAVGVVLWNSPSNTFYHNNFINNTDKVYITNSIMNTWDDGYPSGGNYWSDYTGVDLFSGPGQDEPGSDGIGDTPYSFVLGSQDNYPLMDPWTPPRIHVNPLISYAGVGEIFSIDIRVADVTNLYSFAFVLGYNTTFLDPVEVIFGPFLNEPTSVLRSEINEDFGFVWVEVTSEGTAAEVDGSGTLATIFFYVKGLGECVLDLYDTNLSESDGFPIDHSVGDGFYEGGMTQVVSTESNLDSYHPSLAVDLVGNVHVAWHDLTDLDCGTDWDIFYKKRNAEGGWTETEVVSTESNGTSAYPSLAVDSSGNVHVAWHDNTTDYGGSEADWDIFYKRRDTEGGWTMTEVVSTESTGNSFFPSLAVDLAGNVHIAWEDETPYAGSGSDWDIFYKNHTSSGSPTEVVSINNKDSFDPSLAVDPSGNIHIAWEDYTGGPGSGNDLDILYRKLDVILGWSDTEVVSTESTEPSYDPSLAVAPGGTVHVAWSDDTDYGSGSDRDIFYKNHTSSWSPTEVVSTESNATSWVPSLAVDLVGNVHVAWDDRPDSNWTIFYKRYEVVKANWTMTQVVSTESTQNSWVASLAVDSSRNVHIAWHDVTDYAGCGSDADIFYKYLCLHSTTYPWPMFHHNIGHTGYTESPAPNTNKTQWTYTTKGAVQSSPAVAYGMVFVGSSDGDVYALDQHTGALVWNYPTGTSTAVYSSPAVAYDNVYVASFDHKVYCLDAATGAHLWNRTTGGWMRSSPTVADGRVYVGSDDTKVYCFDAFTGEPIWNQTTGGWMYTSSPAVVDGRVYVGSMDNKTYCLDASTGAHVWNYTTGDDVWSSPAVADGKVYVGSWDGKVYCLNAVDGTHIWNYTTNSVVYSSPAVADDMLFVGSDDNNVYAIGSIIRVPEDYPTIQEAIDAATPGDTISIAAGKHREHLKIQKKKKVKLMGRRGSSTEFAGGGSGIAVTIIDSSEITVTNVVITNWDQGIVIDNSSECQIYDNIMFYMGDSGIALEGDNVTNNLIHNNTIYSNNIAINLTESSTGNVIYGNTISENQVGINVGHSTGNTIYWNSFVNNMYQVNVSNPSDNAWDNGSEGNYWSNYNGTDADGDGIGDTPHIIDGNNQDNYPLMSPYEYWGNPMLCDSNKDMKVDYEDLFQLAAAYGSTPEKLNWNPNCDYNQDHKVEVLDLFNLGKNYGKIDQ